MRLYFCSLLVATASAGLGGAAQAQSREGTVGVTIDVQSARSAHVQEWYRLRASSQPIELRALVRACTRIANLAATHNSAAVALVVSQRGPWASWRDTTTSSDTVQLVVSYDVPLDASGRIPLLHLATPLTKPGDAPAVASMFVQFIGHEGQVAFPRMTRQAPTKWIGWYVAVPSFVQVGSGAGSACDEATGGGNGGLVWRFFLLVGIMVAWVPLYLAWARRTGEGA